MILLELFQLRYFFSVAKYENFSKAADELMVTQPSISKAISSLEKELDVSLFNRKGKKIALNDAGRLLQSRMYDVMPVLDNLANELRAIDDADGSVIFLKILAVHESVARLLIRYRRENPSVTFRLVWERNASTFDLCFSAVPHEVNITNGKLALREEIMLAVPDTSELAGAESVDLCDVRSERFIAMKREGAEDGGVGRFFELCGYKPEIAYYSDSPYITRDLIAAGVGVSLWPASAWRDVPIDGIRLIRINNPVCCRSICITWPSSGIRNRNVQKFLDYAEAYFRNLSLNPAA